MTAKSQKQGGGKKRRGRGRPFPKGKSGNPHGVPAWFKELRALAGSHAPDAIDRLVTLMRQRRHPNVARAAAEAILDRAGLKPYSTEPDKLQVTGDGNLADVVLARLAAARAARAAGGAGARPDAGATGGAGAGDTVAAAAGSADAGVRQPG